MVTLSLSGFFKISRDIFFFNFAHNENKNVRFVAPSFTGTVGVDPIGRTDIPFTLASFAALYTIYTACIRVAAPQARKCSGIPLEFFGFE